MTLFRLPEPPPEEKTICEMDMRCLEHLRADSYKQGLEAAALLFNQPHKEYFGQEIQDAIRKLMEGL